MATSAAALYETFFLRGHHHLEDLFRVCASYKGSLAKSVESQGDIFLDRDVNQADVDFMKATKLKDIDFSYLEDDSKFMIVNTALNRDENISSGMLCSNRFGSKGELRGVILRNKLLEKLREPGGEELTLYDVMQKFFQPEFKDSTDYIYSVTAIPSLKNNHQLFLNLANRLLPNLPDSVDGFGQLTPDEQEKFIHENKDQIISENLKSLKQEFLDYFELKDVPAEKPKPPRDMRGTISRNIKKFAAGVGCLALVGIGIALTATGILAAIGVPTLIAGAAMGAAFLGGTGCAGGILYEDYQHRQAVKAHNGYNQILADSLNTCTTNNFLESTEELDDTDSEISFEDTSSSAIQASTSYQTILSNSEMSPNPEIEKGLEIPVVRGTDPAIDEASQELNTSVSTDVSTSNDELPPNSLSHS